MVSQIFAFLCLGFAAYAGWQMRRLRRDPDNWHMDPKRGGLVFQAWLEFSLWSLMGLLGIGAVAAGLVM